MPTTNVKDNSQAVCAVGSTYAAVVTVGMSKKVWSNKIFFMSPRFVEPVGLPVSWLLIIKRTWGRERKYPSEPSNSTAIIHMHMHIIVK
jgi:hypothetical protein